MDRSRGAVGGGAVGGVDGMVVVVADGVRVLPLTTAAHDISKKELEANRGERDKTVEMKGMQVVIA